MKYDQVSQLHENKNTKLFHFITCYLENEKQQQVIMLLPRSFKCLAVNWNEKKKPSGIK